jgi:hypothetical protein
MVWRTVNQDFAKTVERCYKRPGPALALAWSARTARPCIESERSFRSGCFIPTPESCCDAATSALRKWPSLHGIPCDYVRLLHLDGLLDPLPPQCCPLCFCRSNPPAMRNGSQAIALCEVTTQLCCPLPRPQSAAAKRICVFRQDAADFVECYRLRCHLCSPSLPSQTSMVWRTVNLNST